MKYVSPAGLEYVKFSPSCQPPEVADDARYVHLFDVLACMSERGGGFVGRLADAWKRADSSNSNILRAGFEHLLEQFARDWVEKPRLLKIEDIA